MSTPLSPDHITVLSPAAMSEWDGHVEGVLRGVAHALNNRAASMSALTTLCMEPDYTRESTRDVLASEVDRLHDIVAVIRAIGAPRGNVEAFDPADAARSAKAVLALHAGLRDRVVTISASAGPIRAHRWMFVRAVVVLACRVAAADRTPAITLSLSDRDGWVYVVGEGATHTARSAFLDEIVPALGGEPLPGAAGFRVPSLATLRQREGR